MRSRDLTILTIGLVRYTKDIRFNPIHGQGTNNWGLKVIIYNALDRGGFVRMVCRKKPNFFVSFSIFERLSLGNPLKFWVILTPSTLDREGFVIGNLLNGMFYTLWCPREGGGGYWERLWPSFHDRFIWR